jgi:7-keto-8-aminopelargonate synthetase-like enzyme
MSQTSKTLELIDQTFQKGVVRGIVHLHTDREPLSGRQIVVNGRTITHFGSCSYLGLELDPRLKQAAAEAAERYGVQFSSSRAYIGAPLYEELEALLDRIFGAHTLITPNTTLAHMSALPVLVDDDDAVILDHQVHQSVQMVMPTLHFRRTHVEFVRHGRLDLLEERIDALEKQHPRIWYLADGVYSMFGDFAPMKALAWLLARHEKLNLYVDDAHGMSWFGRHGRGFAAESLEGHERVVIAVSLNKGFGAAGGALVFRDLEQRRRVRTCAGPQIFTGPVQPPLLGAAVASARIHLSPEIERLQARLYELIRFTNRTARELDIPLASTDEVPLRFVGLSAPNAAIDMATHLLDRGFFINTACFPAVSVRRSGVRFVLNVHLTPGDARNLLETIAERMPASLEAGNTTRKEIDRVFRLEPLREEAAPPPLTRSLSCQHESSIRAFDAAEWDACLGSRGTLDATTLGVLEEVFGLDGPPENRWRFHYFVVRDSKGKPVLATFFTEALWKDDLLASASVSKAVEQRREGDPYFLTSRSLAMGTLLTEGDHLYLPREGEWRSALTLLLAAVNEQQDECQAASVVLRDLSHDDAELADALIDAGFFRVELPDTMVIDIDWSSQEEFLSRRSKRERRFHRERVAPWEAAWEVDVVDAVSQPLGDEAWEHVYRLYRNVQSRQLALNTFPLPEDLLPRLAGCPGWEILMLRLKPEAGGRAAAPPQGFIACHANGGSYNPVFVGMDYDFVESHGLYRQLLSKAVQRAQARGASQVCFGMGSELEKTRFGARPVKRVMFVQSYDRYHHDVLSLIAAEAKSRPED